MEKIERLEELVRQYLKNRESVAHDVSHLLRVKAIADKIAKLEGADTELVEAAALLHDIGREEDSEEDKYYYKSAQIGEKLLLEAGYDKEFIRKVIVCIESHSRSSSTKPEILEARVIFDADKIDGLGYVGIARWYLAMGRMGLNVEDSTRQYLHTLTESYEKLGGRLFTKTGSKMVEERYKLSKKFAMNLLTEID